MYKGQSRSIYSDKNYTAPLTGILRTVALLSISMPMLDDEPYPIQSHCQQQSVDKRCRTGDPVEAGECEKQKTGHNLRKQDSFGDVHGIVQGKIT